MKFKRMKFQLSKIMTKPFKTNQYQINTLPFIIATLAFGVYINALFNGFIWDDELQVINNHWIRDMRYLPEIFSNSVWGFEAEAHASNYYRPLMNVIYMFNYHVFGLRPLGYHLINILFHVGSSILVFLLASQVFSAKDDPRPKSLHDKLFSVPFMAAALFATHPIHTEAVTWVAGLPDVSYTFFYLLSLLLYIQATSNATLLKTSYVLSVLSFFLATLCKEPAITLAVSLIVFDYGLRRKPILHADALKRYLPYFLVAGCYIALRIYALGAFAPYTMGDSLSYYELVIIVCQLFLEYLQKLLFPIGLSLFNVLEPPDSLLSLKGLISFIVIFIVLGNLYFFYKKNRKVFFSLTMIVVPLLPLIYVKGIMENWIYVSERYLYLPSFGFAMLSALLLKKVQLTLGRNTHIFGLILLGLIGMYSFGTVSRNAIWQNNFTLFSDTVKKSPNSEQGRTNFAYSLQKMGRSQESVEHLLAAIKLNPYNYRSYFQLGIVYFELNRTEDAISQFERSLSLNQDDAAVYDNLGMAYAKIAKNNSAIECYQAALRLNPGDAFASSQLNNSRK